MKQHELLKLHGGLQAAYLANGLVGLRIGQIPLPGGTALVNGFVGLSPEKGVEEYDHAPYPIGADIQLEGVWLSRRPDLVRFERQALDFSCGELHSRFEFSVNGKTARVDVLTFCSRTQPSLVLQEVAVTVDRPAKVVLQSHIVREGLAGRLKYRCMPTKIQDAIIEWEGRGGRSSVGVATITEFAGEDLERQRRNDYGHEEDSELTFYYVDAKPGRRYALRQYGSLVPSLMNGEPHWQASRLVGVGKCFGFEALRAANRAAWDELWLGRPRLVGADGSMQDVADASFFYLHSSVHPGMPCSVAPFGLSRRAEYSGHVFWDTETFMFPPVLLTAPKAARAMMDYRSRCLPAAKFNAQLNGYSGVQFPCQSGSHGWEVTPFYAGACGGIREHHFNLDVAFAFAQYVHATDDALFLRQQAWPVLEGVAEWVVSRVAQTARGYEILHVTGIDEGIDDIPNNSETNILAAIVLREAMGFARRMGFEPPSAWQAVSERMFVPIDPVTNVILKHEGYEYKGGMCVPEPLVAYLPFGYSHSPKVDQATIKYYLDLAHTYLGMPMFSALLGVFVARTGDRKRAAQFFDEGIVAHVQAPFMQFNETAKAFDGPFSLTGDTVFLTNPAGFLMALLYGLTGLQLGPGEPQSWATQPIRLPEGWEGIDVERIWARGRPARLSARHGDERASVKWID